MKTVTHQVDLCVVGGGMAGLCAAISAARCGVRVALIHDRPVFGGNASSEVRMHICGADRHGAIPNVRETGILEEIRLENLRRNSQRSYSVWDTVLYEKVLLEPGIERLMNCSCLKAEMDGDRIVSVTGWQTTTQTYHKVEARLFADCSGDAVLAPLTGAAFRMGREARSEFSESIEPETADRKTMGMTCMFQARDTGTPQPFTPPSWACRYPSEDDFPFRGHRWVEMGYWWIELGGEQDSIADTEAIRDELLKVVYGVWDHIKNHGDHGAANWALDWVQFLPGKRESRRYEGGHILTQNDIEAGGRFPDIVAYGGWTMDDHNPGGFNWKHEPNIFHPAPSPYGIPYRCLWSRNVGNLLFAGRCASFTHAALSSTRVMGTAAVMGQAVGTAAAIAVREGLSPREVGEKRIQELQQSLLYQDCYLPGIRQQFSELTRTARLTGSSGAPEYLRDGVNRPVGDVQHAWEGHPGGWVEYTWDSPRRVREATLVFDSALCRNIQMSHLQQDAQLHSSPPELVKEFVLQVRTDGWVTLRHVRDNGQRLVRLPVEMPVTGVRVIPRSTCGAEKVRMFAFYLV